MTDKRPRPRPRDVLRIGRALKLVWSISPGLVLGGAVLTVVLGLLPVAAVWLMKLIVDAVAEGMSASDRAAAFEHVALLIGAAAGVGLLTVILRSLQSVLDEALGHAVTDHMTDLIHAQSVAVDLEYYENPAYHDTLFRAQQEAPYRPTSIVKNLTSTGQALVTLAGMAAFLLTLHWAVGLLVIAAAVPAAIVRFHFSGRLYSWKRSSTDIERKSYYAHWLLTDSGHAKEVRLLSIGERLRTWYADLRQQLRRELLGLARRRSAAEALAGAGAIVITFGTFAYIAWRTIEGAISVGNMVAYYQAFQSSLSALQSVLQGSAALYEDSLFLSYYDEFMALEPKVVEAARPKPVPAQIADGLRFNEVAFTYPGTDRTALSDVSMTIRPGQVTALVGPNGSGKTTLVKLMCRLYDPSAGSVTLDGIDLRDLATTDLRRHMSIIFQDFARYHLTARENIRIGDVSLTDEDPAIERAARDARAHQTITGLRNGYDTVLGRWFDEGEELSVGEWQKIALARAFVRDAQILVCDEPTSALDPQAEWDVFQHIKELAAGRAVVLISHRFSTVRNADSIHIFDQGRVVESGTHDELVELGGRYAKMYEVQAQAYRLGT